MILFFPSKDLKKAHKKDAFHVCASIALIRDAVAINTKKKAEKEERLYI